MDRFRYVIALLVLMSIPLAISYWLVIHPFIHFWRKLGPKLTYTVVGMVLTLVGIGTYALRSVLLSRNLGTNWLLFGTGIVTFAISIVIALQVHRQLTIRTMAGVPEIKAETGGGLITSGVYSRIRHPRYLGLLLGLLGWTFMANYVELYLMFVVFVPALYGIILFEERELRERFGEQYRSYCQRVPRLIPKAR